jgi:hypothetical protein
MRGLTSRRAHYAGEKDRGSTGNIDDSRSTDGKLGYPSGYGWGNSGKDRPAGAGFCFSHRDHSLLREAISSSTCRQAKVVVTSPIA